MIYLLWLKTFWGKTWQNHAWFWTGQLTSGSKGRGGFDEFGVEPDFPERRRNDMGMKAMG